MGKPGGWRVLSLYHFVKQLQTAGIAVRRQRHSDSIPRKLRTTEHSHSVQCKLRTADTIIRTASRANYAHQDRYLSTGYEYAALLAFARILAPEDGYSHQRRVRVRSAFGLSAAYSYLCIINNLQD